MHVLVCPSRFSPDLGASEVGDAIGLGWAAAAPHDRLARRPLGDAGPDMIEAVRSGSSPDSEGPATNDPHPELLILQGVAWVGGGAGSGAPDSSRELGRLVVAAIKRGSHRIVIGLPDTGPPWDGGAGMLAELGAIARDVEGRPVPLDIWAATAEPASRRVAEMDLGPALSLLAGVDLVVATDADFPVLGPRGVVAHSTGGHLTGHSHGHDPRDEGTAAAGVRAPEGLDAALRHWSELLGRSPDGRRASVMMGAGAGGGVAAALLRLGARREPGTATVLAQIGVAGLLEQADLLVVADPLLDHGFSGRPSGLAAGLAMKHAVPVVLLAREAHLSRREWMRHGVSAAFATSDLVPGRSDRQALSDLAARVARTWSPAQPAAESLADA